MTPDADVTAPKTDAAEVTTASPSPTTDADPTRPPIGDVWERTGWIVIGFAFAIGFEIRRNLLTEPGLRGDLDQFVGWVHHIATHGLSTLYSGTDAGPVTFGPVMAYVWATLAAIQPAFATATDASDPVIRAFMKGPATLADLALALIAVYALRQHRKWAALAAVAILFHPAVVDVSAWWGQYESIFVVSAFAALVLAINGHDRPAAALVAVSLMTKPQALPFILPFAAWFWASGYHRVGADGTPGGIRGGAIELVQTGLIGLATILVLWLPFLAEGGPASYLRNLATYQGEIFSVISVRAWNVWWLVQILGAPDGGGFVADDIAFLGPLTLRHVGFLVTGLLSLVVMWAIVRDPRPRTLVLGLTASVLVFFTFMTQMHERYAYAAVIFLVLLLPETRPRWLWLAFGAAFTLNLLAAVPPTPAIAERLPVGGALGIAGAIVMIAITVLTLREMTMRREDDSAGPAVLAS